MKVEQVVIIGAGPAGLSAAIQLKRYGITALLLERDEAGGLLRNANLVENYPGFPGGIPGAKLVRLFQEQASQTGVNVTACEVTRLSWDRDAFEVHTHQGAYRAKIAVIASGTTPRTFTDLRIPSECRKRLFYEVHPFVEQEGARFAIVGAGDAAFDYALNLARRNQVVILNRGKHVNCLPLLWERTSACERITYHAQTEVLDVQCGPKNELRLNCSGPGGGMSFFVDYLIGALGREPQVAYLANELRQAVNVPEYEGKLYWIGDVKNGIYRQTSIAVGDGIRAAMHIYQYLKENTA